MRWICLVPLLMACKLDEEVAAILELPPNTLAGAELFNDHCATCHNVDGTGISGPNIQFSGDQQVVAVLLDPPFEMRDPVEDARLSEQDIADIAAYMEREL